MQAGPGRSPAPELVALAVAVVAVAVCLVGLSVALALPWLGFALGGALAAVVAFRLGARALDERTNRKLAEAHRPDPPAAGAPAPLARPVHVTPPDQQY